MKLNEIAIIREQDDKEIIEFLEYYGMHSKNYSIHGGIVDLKFSAVIGPFAPASQYGPDDPRSREIVKGKLPVKFGKVKNNFEIYGNDLTTLEGCPTYVGGEFNCQQNPNLKSLKHMPRHIGKHCKINATGITSLVGIADMVDHIGAEFYFDCGNIKEGGLGLLLIDGLKKLSGTSDSPLNKPFKIIKKYLGQPDKIFDCQQELIDAGFEDIAQH